jgi:hypothetical protein
MSRNVLLEGPCHGRGLGPLAAYLERALQQPRIDVEVGRHVRSIAQSLAQAKTPPVGGRLTYEFPGPDGRPSYVGLAIGESSLGIAQVDDADFRPAGPISLWLYVDDCDAAVDRL